jgi:hypothetical protein
MSLMWKIHFFGNSHKRMITFTYYILNALFESVIMRKRGSAKHCVKDNPACCPMETLSFGYLPNRNPHPINVTSDMINQVGKIT